MSRKSKLRDERQKATSAPKEPRQAKPRVCDDPLTTLAETMRPAHRKFAEGVLAGRGGAKAAIDAGFAATSAKSIAHRLLRREDVRQYIHLAQREQAVASRASLAALVDRLWRTVTDANASVRAQEQALRHLVRIKTAGGAVSEGPAGRVDDDGLGLTDAKARQIEAQLLGVRRP